MNTNETHQMGNLWAVVDGPYSVDDFPEDESIPEDWTYFIVARVSTDEEPEDLFDHEVWFNSFDEAYEFKQGVNSCMEPIKVYI